MAGNRQSSRGLPKGAPQRGHGGTLSVPFANTELPVSRQYERYEVEGPGTVVRLTALPKGFVFSLRFNSAITFVNSLLLKCLGGGNVSFAAGDSTEVISLGDGVWQMLSKSFVSSEGGAAFDAMQYGTLNINGGVDVSQELGSASATLVSGTAKYTADCWEAQYVHGANTAVLTSQQYPSSSFPAPMPGYSNGHLLFATTAITSPANGDYAVHRTKIDGYRVAKLGWGAAGAMPIAYCFTLWSAAAGVGFLKFSNSGKTRCYYQEVTVGAGVNFCDGTIAGDTSGTWLKTNGVGLIVEFFSSGKAASPAAPGAWGSTSTTQTTNSTNLLGTNNNATILTGFGIWPGTEAAPQARAPYVMRPFDQELILCQRQWTKSYDYGTAVGAITRLGVDGVYAAAATGLNFGGVYPRFPVRMLTNPVVVVYSSGTGAAGYLRDAANNADIAANIDLIGDRGFRAFTATGTGTSLLLDCHFTANARL